MVYYILHAYSIFNSSFDSVGVHFEDFYQEKFEAIPHQQQCSRLACIFGTIECILDFS
jgi:hypothetical protein